MRAHVYGERTVRLWALLLFVFALFADNRHVCGMRTHTNCNVNYNCGIVLYFAGWESSVVASVSQTVYTTHAHTNVHTPSQSQLFDRLVCILVLYTIWKRPSVRPVMVSKLAKHEILLFLHRYIYLCYRSEYFVSWKTYFPCKWLQSMPVNKFN